MDKRIHIPTHNNNPYIGYMHYANSKSILYKSPTLRWSKLFPVYIQIKNTSTQTSDVPSSNKSTQTTLDLLLDENFFS
jgi:hypothetical protein